MRLWAPSAVGSDIPRSAGQYVARKMGSLIVFLLGLNRGGFLATEIVQQIYPVIAIPTKFGDLRCRGGHGRLRWRALTFYREEPETIQWLECMKPGDVFWDIGANVGLYSIYAAKAAKCKVLAVEPEAQNYALCLENIVLNEMQEFVEAANFAIASRLGIGKLRIPAVTKGGAYNQFAIELDGPGSLKNGRGSGPISQTSIGVSLDDLVDKFCFEYPTYIKLDVDGNEPEIISGAIRVLNHERCKSLLVEVDQSDPRHGAMLEQLRGLGYKCISERSNWESRPRREREEVHPNTNMIFSRI